jgi:hypothetical protein
VEHLLLTIRVICDGDDAIANRAADAGKEPGDAGHGWERKAGKLPLRECATKSGLRDSNIGNES